MTLDWLNNLSLFFQLIGSFFIAFFTISYSQYLREKQQFEAGIAWFLSEIGYIQSCIDTDLKQPIRHLQGVIEKHPETKNFGSFFFPPSSILSFDRILSQGFALHLGYDNYMTIINLKYQLSKLQHLKEEYYLLIEIQGNPPITIVDFNKNSLAALKTINALIESFEENVKKFQPPKYPYTYFQYIFQNFKH